MISLYSLFLNNVRVVLFESVLDGSFSEYVCVNTLSST